MFIQLSYLEHDGLIIGKQDTLGSRSSHLDQTAWFLYNLLTEPFTFDSYIACSAGFPGCEEYFMNLAKKMKSTYSGRKTTVFLTNGLKDPLDPVAVIIQNVNDFSNLIDSIDSIRCKYLTYDNEGHVPYQSVYHGLRFIYGTQKE